MKFFISLLLGAAFAFADTTATFTMTKWGLHLNNWVSSGSSTCYVGGYPRGQTGGYSEEVLSRYDLSALKSVTITSATLQFKVSGSTAGSFPDTVTLYEQTHKAYNATGDYNYYYVNYVVNSDDVAWNSPCGTRGLETAPSAASWQSITSDTLKTLVQNWIDGKKANNGLVLGGNFGFWGYTWTISDVQLVLTWATTTPVIPVITTEPKDTAVVLTSPVSLTVAAKGTAPLTYSWYKTAVVATNLIASQTAPTFSLASAQMSDTGVYRCVVKNASGADTSRAAHIAVTGGKPVITGEPHDTTILERSALNLPVAVTGTAPFTYAWYKGSLAAGNRIASQTTFGLTFASILVSDSGIYNCVVSNALGADTSRAAHVIVQKGNPVITKEPHDTAVLASSAFSFSVTATGIAPLAYQWYKTAATPANLIAGQTASVLSFPSAQTSDSGSSFICVVSNTYGADTSLVAHLSVASNVSITNPVVVRGTFSDSTHVRLTISRYVGLPSVAPLLFPWSCDTVFVWYHANAWPANPPPRGGPNQLAFSVKQLQTRGGDQYDTLVSVVKNASPTPCYRYDFLGSVNWKSGTGARDSLPYFKDTASAGASIVMCDTSPLQNPVKFSFAYVKGSDSVTVTLSNLSQVSAQNWSRAASMTVSYTVFGSNVYDDVIPVSTLSAAGNTFSKVYHDPRFAGVQKSVLWQAVINGLYGSKSPVVVDSCTIGFSRPVNTVKLVADSVTATKIRLTWTRPAPGIDSIRIWYGSNLAPLTTIDLPSTDYSLAGPFGTADTSAWITGLRDSTLYYFGLQVEQGGLWSFITVDSRTLGTTLPLLDTMPVKNKVNLTGVTFDSVSNRLAFEWSVDTTGLQLEAGIVWTQDTGAFSVPNPPSNGKIVPIVSVAKTAYYLDVSPPVLSFGSLYRFGIWLRKVDGKWSAPTPASATTFLIQQPVWQKISIFPVNVNQLSVFGGLVVLQKDTVRGSQFYENDATLRKTSVPSQSSGCIPVSPAFSFEQQSLPPMPFSVGLKYDSIPTPYTSGDVRMYHYDKAKSLWLVDTAQPAVNEAVRIISITTLGSNCMYPFVLMIDTTKPDISVLSDTAGVLVPGQDIETKWRFSDNISNVKTTLFWGRADEALFRKDTIVSACQDTIRWVIPGSQSLVIEDFGIRALVAVTDGRFSTTIDISRNVSRTKSNSFTPEYEKWIPLTTTAVLDSPDVQKALAGLCPGTPWTYDITKFRMFQWAKQGWMEYSNNNRNQFAFVPGRVTWLKTRSSSPLDLGSGHTVSLKSPCTVSLQASGWSDVSIPFQFPIRVGDVLISTVVSGALQASEQSNLEICEWRQSTTDAKGRYFADPIYMSGMAGKMDLTTVLSYREGQGLAYAVRNDLPRAVNLLIPPTPVALSQVPLAKQAKRAGWSVAVRSSTADCILNPVYCGYMQGGAGTTDYSMPPTWSEVNVGIVDEASGKMTGSRVTHVLDNGGCSFKLVFKNDKDAKDVVAYSVERFAGVGKDVRIAIIDPSTGLTKDAESRQTVAVDGHDSQYRWLSIGSDTYIRSFGRKVICGDFGFVRISPNPFRGILRIDYAVPASGVEKVRFEIIDQLGRVVSSVARSAVHPGMNQILWDPRAGRGLAAGIYLVRLSGLSTIGKSISVRQARVMYLP